MRGRRQPDAALPAVPRRPVSLLGEDRGAEFTLPSGSEDGDRLRRRRARLPGTDVERARREARARRDALTVVAGAGAEASDVEAARPTRGFTPAAVPAGPVLVAVTATEGGRRVRHFRHGPNSRCTKWARRA